MSTEQHKATIGSLLDATWNRGDIDALDELVSPDYVGHDPHTPGGAIYGPAGLKKHFAVLRAAVPDATMTIDDFLGEADRTVVRFTVRGTHSGTLMGIPPSGRSVQFAALLLSRFDGSSVVEDWGFPDLLSLLQQIGAVPSPEAVSA